MLNEAATFAVAYGPMKRSLLPVLLLLLVSVCNGQKVGLVLSGGGAVGMTHIGVLKALEENGIPIDYITGSSMGALIGAMYCSGWSPAQIDSTFKAEQFMIMASGGIEPAYQYHFKQDPPDATILSLRLDLDTALQTSLPTNLRNPSLIDYEQMLSYGPVSALAGYDLDSLFVPFRCVASDITDQRSVVFSKGDLAQVVRASMSYPFYFRPIRVDGNLMMDGGLYNNFPSDVMYTDFLPDYIVGSNVSYNSPGPSEDDLVSQLRAMIQERSEYSIACENGVIIEPQTTTSLFDFSDPGLAIADGYTAAMARMPEILAQVHRRVPVDSVMARRKAFRDRLPPMVFSKLNIHGLTKPQAKYVQQSLQRNDSLFTSTQLKPKYFRLVGDKNISSLYPKATYRPEKKTFDLDLYIKSEKDLEVRFGGIFSSRPINTGMVALRYNLWSRSSAHVEAISYFGKFYSAGQLKLRAYLSTKAPLYVEPVFNFHRWDYFSSFSTFFDDVKPSFVVTRELWGGVNMGMGLDNKGLLKFDAKYGEIRDQYYQSENFGGQDTADVTTMEQFTTGLLLERNSLNRKQHANVGDRLSASVRYIGGIERTRLGSTSDALEPQFIHRHDWLIARATIDQYFLPRGIFKFGFYADGVFSTMTSFQNYTESVIRSPAYQPTPESPTYFMPQFRSPKYVAGGIRMIIAVARNRFDLRLEGHIFQPYEPFITNADGTVGTAAAFSKRYYLGSGSLIYQSPVGPIWFNLSYFDGNTKPWAWSINYGYILFNQRLQE